MVSATTLESLVFLFSFDLANVYINRIVDGFPLLDWDSWTMAQKSTCHAKILFIYATHNSLEELETELT